MSELQKRYKSFKEQNLNLNMQRGQPSDENFDLSNPMLTAVDGKNTISSSGIEIRNYPGGPAGLKEARELFCKNFPVDKDELKNQISVQKQKGKRKG